jgi:hypothetical protein
MSTGRLPPASHLELAQHCVFPWSSGIHAPRRAPERPSQRYGNAFHALAHALVAALRVGGELARSAIAEPLAAKHGLSEADTKRLVKTAPALIEVLESDLATAALPELGLAFSLLTGQAREAKNAWELDAQEMYGRADLVFRTAGGLRVRDWKPRGEVLARRPERHHQLRFLGMAAASLYGESQVTVELAYVDEDGHDIVPGELGSRDFMVIEAEACEVAERVQQPPEPRPGPWCAKLWCPIRAVCPATTAALAKVHQDLEAFPLLGEPLSPEHAAWQRHRLPVLRAALDEQEKKIEAFALHHGPIPVEGKPEIVWGPVEKHGNEKLDLTPEAEKLIHERLGATGAEVAIEKSASKASIERGAKANIAAANGGKVKRGAVPLLVKPLLDDLRATKAIKRGAKYTAFDEFKRPAEGAVSLELAEREDEPADDAVAEEGGWL